METRSVTPAPSLLRRLQVLAVSIAGALAVVCFLLSLLLEGGLADTLRIAAIVTAAVCIAVGLSFAVIGGRR